MSRIIVDAKHPKSKISRHIYGHFSEHLGRCVYEGLYVGDSKTIPNVNGMRSDVVGALRDMGIPSLRWPGGCFADEYHWKDGIGEKSARKRMVNTHWGGVTEDNSFGTHEFFELCRQLDCEPYVNGNVGSGTVQEMQEWVEYMTFGGESPMSALRAENGAAEPWKLKYFGVGNESWGCGGNMCPEYYASLYKRYATYVRNYGGNKIFRIASGPGTSYGTGERDLNLRWTDVLMQKAHHMMDGYSLHYYTVPNVWERKGCATEFDSEEYYRTLRKALWLDEIIRRHAAVIERYDPDNRIKIIFDEWGTWYDAEAGTNPGFLYQQNTMRDALVAAVSLNIFNKRSDAVHMANIAQTVNVLQAMILTDKEKMTLTPTYHVFRMFKTHRDAALLESSATCGDAAAEVPEISHSASVAEDGTITLTVANLSADSRADIDLTLLSGDYGFVSGELLTGDMHARNDLDTPPAVKTVPFEGFSVAERNKSGTQAKIDLPPCAVASIIVKQG
ncbi:intracellular exo-alpha-L-arabinofuranosidase 2 [Clostridia bacterium]|nr:intracellular exo-alpha-L-arabinofuranosidase 2 [Clostridia bacterium]GHV37190.1 intracellular exo-alpha-L-arabinofuranosidase 2 [Clostridia bacterium]